MNYISITDEFINKGIKIDNLYDNIILLSKQDEGEVYYTIKGGEKYILKKRYKCSECLLHEFNVGCKLNEINSPHLIKYLAYIPCYCKFNILSTDEDKKSSFILMEYAEGKTLKLLYKEINEHDFILIVYHILLIIADLQSKIKFTHYDLHFNNIIVNTTMNKKIYKYNCFGNEYSIETSYEIKIIDFGSSYVCDVLNDWVDVNINSAINGVVPSVYDNFYDICYLVNYFLQYIKIRNEKYNLIIDEILNLQRKNNFIDDKCHKLDEIGRFLYNGREFLETVFKLMRLYPTPYYIFKFWNTNIYSRNDIDDLINQYNEWYYIFKDTNVQSNEEFDLKDIENITKKYYENHIIKRKIDTYNSYISVEIINIKRYSVQHRNVSIYDYFDSVIKLFTMLLNE